MLKHHFSTLLFGLALCAAGCGAPDESALAETDEQIELFAAPALLSPPSGRATRHPIVLTHGFDASPTNRWGFNGVSQALRQDGHTVIVATVPPYDSPAVRAMHLARYVDQALATGRTGKVNILAHSMGGLDSRELISVLGYGDRVASLTTISSPHRGTRVADVALRLMPGSADDAINALASAWGRTYSTVAQDSHLRDAMSALAESNAARFNAAHPNDTRVYYQSWAGVSSVLGVPNPKDFEACEGRFLTYRKRRDAMDALLVPVAGIVAHGTELRPNDGLATVESAKHGTFRGCIPADHLDQVGQIKDTRRDTRTGFDHLRFYRTVAFDLAKRGF